MTMLDLPLLDADKDGVTEGDLYLRWVTGENQFQDASWRCSVNPEHLRCRMQRRVVGEPNILVVRVMRADPEQGRLLKYAVRPELRLDNVGVGRMDLWGIVYHVGASLSSGHYSAAVRDAYGNFRMFDDRTDQNPGLRQLREGDVEHVRQTAVYLMVYVRAGGSADFAGVAAGKSFRNVTEIS